MRMRTRSGSVEDDLVILGINPERQSRTLRERIEEIEGCVRSHPHEMHQLDIGGLFRLEHWECEAFLADVPETEGGFQAEFARNLRTAVGFTARIEQEVLAFFETMGVDHLWKQHIDALFYLLYDGERHLGAMKSLADTAARRGMPEKAVQLTATAGRLKHYLAAVCTHLERSFDRIRVLFLEEGKVVPLRPTSDPAALVF
jgi:hypothetical protein